MRSRFPLALAASLFFSGAVLGREIPASVRALRDKIKAQGDCQNKLATGFRAGYDSEGEAKHSYCGDYMQSNTVIHIQKSGGELADMDIDCDGQQNGPGSDGRCASSTDTQSQTSFKSEVAGYNAGISDLNSYVHSFAVFGNVDDTASKKGWPTFDPLTKGLKPLSVMAVVCGEQMFYAVWGDENGSDGPQPVVGEASLSLATACFGKDAVNGNKGHSKNDVLYLAFTGLDAVPGAKGAKWNANSFEEFEASLAAVGDALIEKLPGGGNGGGGGGGGNPSGSSTGTPTPSPTSTTRRGGTKIGTPPPSAPTSSSTLTRGKGRGKTKWITETVTVTRTAEWPLSSDTTTSTSTFTTPTLTPPVGTGTATGTGVSVPSPTGGNGGDWNPDERPPVNGFM